MSYDVQTTDLEPATITPAPPSAVLQAPCALAWTAAPPATPTTPGTPLNSAGFVAVWLAASFALLVLGIGVRVWRRRAGQA